jgi:hypothetical protein
VGLSSQAVLEISQRSLVCTSAFPALRRLRQENCEFEANLGYIVYRGRGRVYLPCSLLLLLPWYYE